MAELPHILVVDDDARLRGLLHSFLTGQGYRVTVAASAAAARQMMEGLAFDALVVDVMMPGETGLSFVKDLRGGLGQVPVLMLSALSDAQDRIAGLASGSDDYLSKPFEPQELLLRLNNILRRARPAAVMLEEVEFGPFSFRLSSGELKRADEAIRLTTREKEILRVLARAEGKAVSRAELAGEASADATRKIDVQINRLRQKIEVDPANPRFLQTLRGQGYALFGGAG
ncbi:MAG: response regulator [Alphaproteobacteria bacterium]|nr:response regulator [Alphaproteobacteria bacterium]